MDRFHKDTLVAIFLLLFCGVFLAASFEIRETNYASLGAEVWPQIILALLSLLSFGYLVQSLRQPQAAKEAGGRRFKAWFLTHLNALWCFVWFGLFLVAMPYLGMLVGGCLFVFATLTSLGRRNLRGHVQHAAIAVISVGFMWLVFTFGLKVFLPEGEIFSGF